MNDYTRALHQRFCREPEDTEEERDLSQAEQALKDTLDREQKKLLLALVNAQSLWQGRVSLESFTAGVLGRHCVIRTQEEATTLGSAAAALING